MNAKEFRSQNREGKLYADLNFKHQAVSVFWNFIKRIKELEENENEQTDKEVSTKKKYNNNKTETQLVSGNRNPMLIIL